VFLEAHELLREPAEAYVDTLLLGRRASEPRVAELDAS
jgi:hypothetical protein